MANISGIAAARNALLQITPSDKYAYFDMLQLWLKSPLRQSEIDWLRSECGSVEFRNQTKRWDRSYKQWIQLRQPKADALQMLARLDETRLNYVEAALDWIFASEAERDEADSLISRYHVKRWHGEQQIEFHRNITRYTSRKRSVPNQFVSYADLPCRITGELFCLHLEWRLSGVQALQRAGISSVAELLTLDHRQFWQERLLLRTINVRALGRSYIRQVQGKRRRSPWIARVGRIVFDYELRAAFILMRKCATEETFGSTQAIVDEYRQRFEVNRCLDELGVGHLLPEREFNAS